MTTINGVITTAVGTTGETYDYVEDADEIHSAAHAAEHAAMGLVASVTSGGALGASSTAAENTAGVQATVDNAAPGTTLFFPSGWDGQLDGAITLNDNIVQVLASGATIEQTADSAIWYKAGTVELGARNISGTIEIGEKAITLDDMSGLAVDDWLFVRSGDLTPNVTAGSRCAMIRRITSITATVGVDASFYRAMSTTLTARKISLAGRTVFTGGTYTAATQEQANFRALFDFLLCYAPDFQGVTITDSGAAAIRLAHCVGGSFAQSHISDLLDDEPTAHFGYGVFLGGACRGFQFLSGTVGKVRHAITTGSVFATVQGTPIATPLPAAISTIIEGKGEPEGIYYGPVYVYATTNAGLDCHEQGFGITITPNVHGCFEGVLVRCSDAHVSGGQIVNCRRNGVRLDYASSNAAATVTIDVTTDGLVIQNVGLDGTGGAESCGVSIEADGAAVALNNTTVRGYAVAGVYVIAGGALDMSGGLLDGVLPAAQVGILADSDDISLQGVRIKNNFVGIDNNTSVALSALDVQFAGNTTNVSGVDIDQRNDREWPIGHFGSGRYYCAGNSGSVSTSATLTNDVLRVSPLYIRKSTSLDRIAAEVTAAGSAGSTLRIGIYADTGAGYPGQLVIDAGTIDGTVVAAQELTIAVTLQPGLYWLGGSLQGSPASQPTFRVTTASSFTVGASSLAASTQATVGYTLASVNAALPSTFTAGQNAAGVAPRVAFRVV